jgi:hypothetical protein
MYYDQNTGKHFKKFTVARHTKNTYIKAIWKLIIKFLRS